MKIAFVHYHLKTGGVTTVIKQQVEALAEDCKCLVISGAEPQSDFPADVVVIPELAYSTVGGPSIDARKVARSIKAAIRQALQSDCDVLHVHNPILAKNRHFLTILDHLQNEHVKLFLQIHDFAEDGRPFSYFPEAYPRDCHYGVLTSRDHEILLNAGLSAKGVHLVPNMITALPDGLESHQHPDNGFVLYPIRGIRRKNIGEAILLSLFFRNAERLVITLPPNSPADLKSYRDWKSFVGTHHLKVEFDAGLQSDFSKLVRAARFLITTSVTEGFGFSFLEPWISGKLLWGRNLRNVTRDFEQQGIRLDHLYHHLEIPLDWIDRVSFFDRWQSCIRQMSEIFDYPIQNRDIASSFEKTTANGCIDFGMLDEDFQKQVIVRLLADPDNLETVRCINPFLADPGSVDHKDKLIHQNKLAVVSSYNRESYRKRLIRIYASVRDIPVHHGIDKKILLSRFINLHEFSLLKWCGYRE